MKLKKSSRRTFLRDANNLALSTGMAYGLDNLFRVLCEQAVAQAQVDYAYRYIHFCTSGGPPRWFFDQPLNPNNKSSEFVTGAFGTVLRKQGDKWNAVHAGKALSFGGKTVHLPPVWALKSSGGTAFSSLLSNTLMIRGVNMEINSHTVNQERTIRPVSSDPSISGLVAEQAKKPISSLGHLGSISTRAYKSNDGTANIASNRNSPISSITSPFNVKEIVKYDDLDYSVHQAVSAIDNYAKKSRMPSQGNEAVLKNSYDMFARNLDSFQSEYSQLLKKYQDIVSAEFKADFPEVTTDLAKIKSDGSVDYSLTSTVRFAAADNLKTILGGANAPNIAPAFAFAEFALKNDLTSSLSLELGANCSNVKNVTITHDQHNVGSISSVIFTNLYFRCLLGCMLEFRKAIGAALWNKTVLQMASEFSRTPHGSGRGSDHGFKSGATSIFSGMINTPQLVGNIYTTPEKSDEAYTGTWGHAAPFLKDPQTGQRRELLNDDVVRTVCEMLQVEKIGTKGVSLVKNSDGKVSATHTGFQNVKRG